MSCRGCPCCSGSVVLMRAVRVSGLRRGIIGSDKPMGAGGGEIMMCTYGRWGVCAAKLWQCSALTAAVPLRNLWSAPGYLAAGGVRAVRAMRNGRERMTMTRDVKRLVVVLAFSRGVAASVRRHDGIGEKLMFSRTSQMRGEKPRSRSDFESAGWSSGQVTR